MPFGRVAPNCFQNSTLDATKVPDDLCMTKGKNVPEADVATSPLRSFNVV